MKYGIKGKGAEIKWVEETDLPLYQEYVKLQNKYDEMQTEFKNLKGNFDTVDKKLNKLLTEGLRGYITR